MPTKSLIHPHFLHCHGQYYRGHYLCPVTAENGFTFQLITVGGEFMSNETCHSSLQAAIAAGKQFLDGWLFCCNLNSICDKLYDQGQLDYSQYRHLSDVIQEGVCPNHLVKLLYDQDPRNHQRPAEVED